MSEKEAIERQLDSEQGTMKRQQLLKELWKLRRRERNESAQTPTAHTGRKHRSMAAPTWPEGLSADADIISPGSVA